MKKILCFFPALISIIGLLVGLSYHLNNATPVSRQEQFLKSCMEVFDQSQQECHVFMERWGRFMQK